MILTRADSGHVYNVWLWNPLPFGKRVFEGTATGFTEECCNIWSQLQTASASDPSHHPTYLVFHGLIVSVGGDDLFRAPVKLGARTQSQLVSMPLQLLLKDR